MPGCQGKPCETLIFNRMPGVAIYLGSVPKVMKRDLHGFALIFFLLIHITGCSVTRFMETRIGYGTKKANRTDLDLDFQLDFNETARSLIVTLEYQPYAIYKPRITLIDLGVGLASLGLVGKVFYDNWDHDHTFTFTDDTFNWYDSEPWEKAVLIGVPIDILLYWGFSYPFDQKAIRLPKQPLIAHPYRIELPDPGHISREYRTHTGREQIEIQKFLSELRHPPYLQDVSLTTNSPVDHATRDAFPFWVHPSEAFTSVETAEGK